LGDDAQKLDIVVTKPEVGEETGVRGLNTAGNEPFLTVFGVKRGAPLNPRRSARPVLPKSALTFRSFATLAGTPLPEKLTLGAVTVGIKMPEVIIEERDAAEESE
jgi:hypothetical protein